MKLKYISFFVAGISIICSCNMRRNVVIDDSKKPIVSVYDQILYKSDIDKLIAPGISVEDSTKIVDAYINSWIKDVLMFEKASKNITESDDLKKLVQEYRKSLLVNEYQTKLLHEKLSQNPNSDELIKFYDRNSDLFHLKDEIIKGIYLKVPVESQELNNLRKLYKETTNDAIESIQNKRLQNTVAYENFYDRWMDFHEVLDNIPIAIEDPARFLKTNKTIEASDSSFVYLLNISDYIGLGELAPFDFIEDKVKATYLEKEKEAFIKELNNDLYQNAEDKGEIVYYNKK